MYVSGCLGLDKDTMKLVPGGPTEQAEKALENLEAVLKAADSGVDKVIKNTVFLKDLNDFGAVNEVYKKGKQCVLNKFHNNNNIMIIIIVIFNQYLLYTGLCGVAVELIRQSASLHLIAQFIVYCKHFMASFTKKICFMWSLIYYFSVQ